MTKVIVIDDQPLEGRMISFVLGRDLPYTSYEGQAFSSEEGIRLAGRVRPDIVFLDISMEEGDGISAIPDLRAANPDMRIVMLTAHAEFDYIQRSMRAGANDYLLKPVRAQDIAEAVERWTVHTEPQGEDAIAEAKRYVEANLDKTISLSDMAEHLYLSPAYFSRLFRSRTGQTFSGWLAARRVERARHYLEESTLTIAEIAQRVGYHEANSFTRVFKSSVGIPPTEYRRNAGIPEPEESEKTK